MCYSVCWETVEGELCLLEVPEAMRCVLLCTMEAVERCAHFRGFEISIVAVFSLQSATSFIE